jgi:16S rRNA (adenine(1408)-N(1))-methyltransferase
MYRVIVKKIVEFSARQLAELVAAHERVVIEVGMGNGAFLRALLGDEPSTLAVGFDPSVEAVERASRIAAQRGDNPVFLRAAIEAPPAELADLADTLHINFPWGSLLRGLVQPDDVVLRNVAGLMKPGAAFDFLLTYHAERDAALGLPELTEEHFERLARAYRQHGLIIYEWRRATPEEVEASHSSWAKRLRSNKERQVWLVRGVRSDDQDYHTSPPEKL